ncbi:MAG: DNA translocase FtsK 4TM domain-containing protein, partial [Gallionella sp.]|nr:DNA translocase FtsK 4TM domain-containing protein [Gallionella sp.]
MFEVSDESSGGKLFVLLRESRWILLTAGALYIALALYGYNPADPAWSHTASGALTGNPAGALGAYLSDLLFYLFGFSAWWLVLYVLQRVWVGYRNLRADSIFCKRAMWVSIAGIAVLLLASSSLEAIRMYTLKVTLPLAPGGMLGALFGNALTGLFGFTGATLLLLALVATSFSVFSGLSWLRLVDWLGELAETAYQRIYQAWQTRQDRRIGAQAMSGREATVEEEKRRRVEEHQAIHIEMPVAEVAKSTRAAREKQKSLFADISDSPLPPLDLLDQATRQVETVSASTLEFTSRLIEHKLKDFGVEVKVVAAYPGPVITRYEIDPATGVKGSQITNLVKDLARALSVVSIRMVETIPGKAYMALELPNQKRQIVHLSEILGSQVYADMGSALTIAMGKDIAGKPVVADLAKMPHVLVAGTTGSGKSVAINAMILSLLYKSTPQQVRLLLIDPKMLELSVYEGIPHLLAPVVTDMRQAASGLNWCVQEMDQRYR